MGEASPIQIAEAIGNFQFNGRLMRGCAYGNGHINDTYLLTFQISGMGNIKVILQKMNKDVFEKPVELMENVMGVTAYLREQIIKNGGDPERETLNVIPAYDGKNTGVLISLLRMPPVMTWWRSRSISIRVRLRSVISSVCWQITRLIR